MSDNFATGIVSVMLAILGVATLAVIFSTKSNATGVIQAGGNALAQNIEAATSPFGTSPTISYPQSSSITG